MVLRDSQPVNKGRQRHSIKRNKRDEGNFFESDATGDRACIGTSLFFNEAAEKIVPFILTGNQVEVIQGETIHVITPHFYFGN